MRKLDLENEGLSAAQKTIGYALHEAMEAFFAAYVANMKNPEIQNDLRQSQALQSLFASGFIRGFRFAATPEGRLLLEMCGEEKKGG